MPRQARLDAPGTVHHVILRGLERGQIVADAQDREAFVARVGALAAATGTTLYVWGIAPRQAAAGRPPPAPLPSQFSLDTVPPGCGMLRPVSAWAGPALPA